MTSSRAWKCCGTIHRAASALACAPPWPPRSNRCSFTPYATRVTVQTTWPKRLLAVIDPVHLVSGYRAGRPVPMFWRTVGLLTRILCRIVFGAAPAPLPGWLGVNGHAARLLARVLFAVRNRDVLCPYRLARREIFARIPLQSDGPFVHVEVLAKANFLGCVLAEDVPLGDAQRPVRAEPRDGPGDGFIKECMHVFDRPDFGPAVLPERYDPGKTKHFTTEAQRHREE